MRPTEWARARRSGGVALAALVSLLLLASTAHAGEWMQVSCVNPSGSAAPSQGWAGSVFGSDTGASANPACAASTPMAAILPGPVPQSVYSGASLTYTPPAGSVLVGGRIGLVLQADGGGTDAEGVALVQEPTPVGSSGVILQCASGGMGCSSQGANYSGTFTLPSGLGGTLTVTAQCSGSPGFSCDTGGRSGAWALAEVSSADLLLQTTAKPGASGLAGSLLGHTLQGTVRLSLDATDTGGPGVDQVGVSIDGRTVAHVQPSTNAGQCVSVGTDRDSGALMFDTAQPCPTLVPAALRVSTAGLPDGPHRLQVVVTDAAGDTATVLTRTVLTVNPTRTPRPRNGPRTRFRFSWRWASDSTTLRSLLAVSDAPRGAGLHVSCTGLACPKLASGGQSPRGLERALRGRQFATGDRLLLTAGSGRHATRVQVTIRADRTPAYRLLGR